MSRTVFEMVHEVLADSEATSQSMQKQASAEDGGALANEPVKVASDDEGEVDQGTITKIADACEYLAENLHTLTDDRTSVEKMAEYMSVQAALQKSAEEIPVNPTLDSGIAPGGPQSAMASGANTQSGDNPAEAGQQGEATPAAQVPKTTEPSESPNQQDAANAMETNKEMMMAEQPEDVLKQSADVLDKFVANGWITPEAAVAAMEKDAGARETYKLLRKGYGAGSTGLGKRVGGEASRLTALKETAKRHKGTAALVGGATLTAGAYAYGKNKAKVRAAQDPSKPGAETASGKSLKKAAGLESVPASLRAAFTKAAEDAINPAQISGGTAPLLQSVAGSPSALNQGSEVGEAVPRETAPTSGQGGGRQFVSSNEAAINYTKGQAKGPQKGALGEVLAEPALSAAHDKTLQQSLSNASDAGVKISATREMLKKIAASSPEAGTQLQDLIKAAMAGEPMPAPGEEVAGAAQAIAAPALVSDEALAAASEGVTTDELAAAQKLMASQAAAASSGEAAAAEQAAAAPAPEAAPAAALVAPPAQPAPAQA